MAPLMSAIRSEADITVNGLYFRFAPDTVAAENTPLSAPNNQPGKPDG
jgi:hypothetical protein